MFGKTAWSGIVAVLVCLAICSAVNAESVLVGTKVPTNQGTQDIYAERNATQYVIYYSRIPGVANPGARGRIYYSLEELRDALRRARNNGWEVDMKRSYFQPR